MADPASGTVMLPCARYSTDLSSVGSITGRAAAVLRMPAEQLQQYRKLVSAAALERLPCHFDTNARGKVYQSKILTAHQ